MPAGDYHLLQQLYNSHLISLDTCMSSMSDMRCLSCFEKISLKDWYSNDKCKNCGQPINPGAIFEETYANDVPLQMSLESIQKDIESMQKTLISLEENKVNSGSTEERETNRFTDFLKND